MFFTSELPYNQTNPHDKQKIQKSYQLELTILIRNESIGYNLLVGPGCQIKDQFQYNTRELYKHNSLDKPYTLFESDKICQLITNKIKETFALYGNTPVSYLYICIKYAGEKKETSQYNVPVEKALIKLEKKLNQLKATVKVLQDVKLEEVTLNRNEEESSEGCILS